MERDILLWFHRGCCLQRLLMEGPTFEEGRKLSIMEASIQVASVAAGWRIFSAFPPDAG